MKKEFWIKKDRTKDEDRLVETILKYMTDWMMVRSEEERITVLPAVGRLAGQYPSDYKGDGEE